MKRPSSKSVAMKKVAKPKTKAAPKKKPAGQHGGKGLLKKPAKAVPEAEKLAEEGEEEEVFSDDEVVNPKVTAKNLKTHQQLLDAKLCSAKEVDKALSKLPPNEAQVLWKIRETKAAGWSRWHLQGCDQRAGQPREEASASQVFHPGQRQHWKELQDCHVGL